MILTKENSSALILSYNLVNKKRVEAAKFHLLEEIRWKGEKLGVCEMRRHYTNYFRGIPNFKPYRTQLVELENYQEIIDVLDRIEEEFTGVFALV